jgi:hypothetical protein
VSRQIHFNVSDHDREQLVLLAAIKKLKLSQLMREIVKAYLDGGKFDDLRPMENNRPARI